MRVKVLNVFTPNHEKRSFEPRSPFLIIFMSEGEFSLLGEANLTSRPQGALTSQGFALFSLLPSPMASHRRYEHSEAIRKSYGNIDVEVINVAF